jgi:hypothetical protein
MPTNLEERLLLFAEAGTRIATRSARKDRPMTPLLRPVAVTLIILALGITTPGAAQRKAVPRPPRHGDIRPGVTVRGSVFIGGYFYDPMFGPYPWWPRTAYPRWYAPIYDQRAELRLKVSPKAAEDAAVYVDGFYAGIVDDFNNVFQSLPLPPGGHRLVLYLDGYRTVHANVYLHAGGMLHFEIVMDRLPPGVASERPEIAPPVPPPPDGTYRPPVTPSRIQPPLAGTPDTAAPFGTLDLRVQPAGARVDVDGENWLTSDDERFTLQLKPGRHRLEVMQLGYHAFATTFEIHEGQVTRLNVSLTWGYR